MSKKIVLACANWTMWVLFLCVFMGSVMGCGNSEGMDVYKENSESAGVNSSLNLEEKEEASEAHKEKTPEGSVSQGTVTSGSSMSQGTVMPGSDVPRGTELSGSDNSQEMSMPGSDMPQGTVASGSDVPRGTELAGSDSSQEMLMPGSGMHQGTVASGSDTSQGMPMPGSGMSQGTVASGNDMSQGKPTTGSDNSQETSTSGSGMSQGTSEPEKGAPPRTENVDGTAQTGKEEKENAVSALSPLSVEGTQLVDNEGNPVQLRGVSTHGLSWYPEYVNEACFRQLKEEWGADVVRLAMYTAESGGYCTDGNQDALKELINAGVKYATECGLYVIIDWHILSDGNPNTYVEQAKDFFAEMSANYGNYTNVLYEICNEPNGGTAWKDIKQYAEQVIEVIREQDEDGIILVGTPNWSQYVDQAAKDPIEDCENIMYTLHYYAATHTDALRQTMVTAVEGGLPIFVSEYGICDASGNGSIDENQANQWVDTLDEYQISYVAWNLSNKSESSAMLKSSCNKVSGFKAEDLSASGKWLYNMLHSADSEGNSGDFPDRGTTGREDNDGLGPDSSEGSVQDGSTGSQGDSKGPGQSGSAGSQGDSKGPGQSGSAGSQESSESPVQSGNTGSLGGSESPVQGGNQGSPEGSESPVQSGNTGSQGSSESPVQGGNQGSPEGSEGPGQGEDTGYSDGSGLSVERVNSWGQGNDSFYQYNLTFQNDTDTERSDWTITLIFDNNITLNNGWNGNYQVNGSTLSISAMDYNRIVPPGGKLEGIGFILQSGGTLTILETKAQ